jgi:hypothetical protein
MPRITDFRLKSYYDIGFAGEPLPRWAGENTPAARAWADGKRARAEQTLDNTP